VLTRLEFRQAALGMLVAIAAAPRVAKACVRTTTSTAASNGVFPCLFWNKRNVPVVLNVAGTPQVSGTGAFDAIRRAEQTWTQTPGSDIQLVDSGFTSDPRVGFFAQGFANVNQVIFRSKFCTDAAPAADPCWTVGGCNNKYNCWEESPGTIALTTTTYNNQCGQLFDADVELNAAAFFFTVVDSPTCPPGTANANCVSTDVQNTVTHELGHLLGLGHSTDPNAVMYPSAPLGEISKRTLSPDDVQCIDEAYPAGQPPGVCVPCATSGCCGGSSAAAMVWLPFLGLLALAGRPRRFG
jgi:hypothetical protein